VVGTTEVIDKSPQDRRYAALLWHRIIHFIRWMGDWEQWAGMALLFITLEIAVRSIEQARWINPQPSLTAILVLAVISGWILSRSHLRRIWRVVIGAALGLIITIVQSAWLMPGQGIGEKISQLFSVLQVFAINLSGNNPVYFAIFIILITWIMGSIAAWFLVRKQNPWFAVITGTTVVLVNLINLTKEYYYFFILYVIAALLFIGFSRVVQLHRWFTGQGAAYPGRSRVLLIVAVLAITLVAVFVTWQVPAWRITRLERWVTSSTQWVSNITVSRINVFAAVPAKQPMFRSADQGDLLFGPNWPQGDEVQFMVNSQVPAYWRTWVYDIYSATGWSNSILTEKPVKTIARKNEIGVSPDGTKLTFSVETELKTDIILTTGEYVSADVPASFLTGEGDTLAVTTLQLNPGDRYTVTSGLSRRAPSELAGAGTDYPASVTGHYLQLPEHMPQQLVWLTMSLTMRDETNYDKVMSIQKYLSRLKYRLDVDTPPEGKDGVDDFIFTQKAGYCVHFASALAVMCRIADIPSRLVVGYLASEQDPVSGDLVLREKNSHAWVEVYFPGYGWIEFDPTPASVQLVSTGSTPPLSNLTYLPDWWWLNYEAPRIDVPVSQPTTTLTKWRSPEMPYSHQLGLVLLYTFIAGGFGLIILFILLGIKSSFRNRIWRLRQPDMASEVYERLVYLASLARLHPEPQQTPLEYVARLSTEMPENSGDLNTIARYYINSCFNRQHDLEMSQEGEILKSRVGVFKSLIKRLPRRRWFYLRLFEPRS
jgi:transglutaminase-like putative cysteine protease